LFHIHVPTKVNDSKVNAKITTGQSCKQPLC